MSVVEFPAVDKKLVIKLLDRSEKTKSTFEAVEAIVNEAFTGIEQPPNGVLKDYYLNQNVFVLYLGDRLVGVAFTCDRNNLPYVWVIAVSKAYRGMGLGDQLLRLITQHYTTEGRACIELTCKIDNPAQMLYFKNGYRVQSVVRGFYGNEGDGLRMRLDLTPKAA